MPKSPRASASSPAKAEPQELVAAETKPEPRPARRGKLKLGDYLPYRLSVAANEVSRLIARAYEDRFGLSIPQWRLVTTLAETGPMMQQELCLRTMMDKVTVSRAAQGLIAHKLVDRSANEQDGRSHLLALTPEGEELYRSVAPTALAFEATLLDEWTVEEVEQLRAQLMRLQKTAASLSKFGFFPTRTK